MKLKVRIKPSYRLFNIGLQALPGTHEWQEIDERDVHPLMYQNVALEIAPSDLPATPEPSPEAESTVVFEQEFDVTAPEEVKATIELEPIPVPATPVKKCGKRKGKR